MMRSLQLFLREHGLSLTLLAAVWIACAVATTTFRGTAGVYTVLLGFSVLGLFALGSSVTMIAGELDLSIAALASVGGVVTIIASPAGLFASIALGAVVGALYGALQGWIIARLQINSLVATVGSMVLLGGVAFVMSGGAPISVSDFSIGLPLIARWGVLAPDSALALLCFLIAGAYLGSTRFGREIYAVGGARAEAFAAGVPKMRPIITAFAWSGFCGGLAGGMAAIKSGGVQAGAYDVMLLQGIVASLIGGISLYGGRGTLVHVAIGVAILTALNAALSIAGAQDYVIQLVTGALLLIVITLEYFVLKRGRQRLVAAH